jgi:hypothetical protein
MSRIRLALVVIAATLLLFGAAQVPQWQTWRADQAPAELSPAISRADLIIVTLQDALLGELTGALQEGGPALAIKSCHLDAIRIAHRVGREEGVAAGRTSDRLRNPTNAPPRWAAPIVTQYAGMRAAEVTGFAVDLGDRLGVMRPIAHRPMCGGCHGPADRFSPGVRDALNDRYPVDRAVGFNNGEIRGWYWVEIPKAVRTR